MIQNQQDACLTVELMERLAHGEFQATELAIIEKHIESCEHCQSLLESVSLDVHWHNDVLPVLRNPVDNDGIHSDKKDDGRDDQGLESLLKLLGPTDDPHKLGRIGTYEVVGVIGRGGMGVVFKAFDAALNRFVAIKMLLPHLAASGAARKRFAREGQAAAAVIDDNVLPIYSVAEWQGVPYLVTQYSRGTTLQKRIQDQGPLELKEILRIGMQVARGLAAAHAQGLVHRDVKPSNILLDGTVERAMLTDFGLARAVDDTSMTRTGIIAGTPQYMSPEQARGGTVDSKSDLFGLGCVMYAMCTGRPPFRAENSYAVLRLITDEEPHSIHEINPDIPDWLCRLIARLMAKSPDERFASAAEVADLLESCLAHVQQPTVTLLPEPLRNTQSVNERKATRRWLTAIGVMLIGLAVLFGFVISFQSQDGTLLIESSVDDITVRVSQGDTVVRRLTVTKAGTKINVAAGSYIVAIEGDVDGIAIENDKVNLRRGGTEIVKLTSHRPAEITMPPAESAITQQATQKLLQQIVERTILYVTDVRAVGQVLYFTLHQRNPPKDALGLLEIQLHCEKPMPFLWTGPAPDAATVVSPQHTLPSIGTGFPLIPLPFAAEGHKVAFIFPDNDSAVVAGKQLAAIGDQSLLDAQRRVNSIEGRLHDDGIIFGEHAAIGRYTTEFRLLTQMDPAPSVNHQLSRFMPATWLDMYVSILTNPISAKRYQLMEAQQQQVLKLHSEFKMKATPTNRHELTIGTQIAIQNVLTPEQDQQVQRDIFVAWNINKFRDAKILDQLHVNDAQRNQIDSLWKAMSQKTQKSVVGEVDIAAERQRLFDEILGLLTREQQQQFVRVHQERVFDSRIPPQPVEMIPAPFDGDVRTPIVPIETHIAVALPTINWRQLYMGRAMEPQLAKWHQITSEQQQRIYAISQDFLRDATPVTRNAEERRAQSAIQALLTVEQDQLLRREIWLAVNATRLRAPATHVQLGLEPQQRQQIEEAWSKFSEEVRQNNGWLADGTDSHRGIFDDTFAVLTTEQRELYLLKLQDPVFDSGFQPHPMTGSHVATETQAPADARLVDILKLRLEKQKQAYPLLDQVREDMKTLDGGGLQILENTVKTDLAEYTAEHPDLAQAFESWQSDYRYVHRAKEAVSLMCGDDERKPLMLGVARILMEGDLKGKDEPKLDGLRSQLGDNPTDTQLLQFVQDAFKEKLPELTRRLSESSERVPHTSVHEEHLKAAEELQTEYLMMQLYYGAATNEKTSPVKAIERLLSDPTPELMESVELASVTKPVAADRVIVFQGQRFKVELRPGETQIVRLPEGTRKFTWNSGDVSEVIGDEDAKQIFTFVICDRTQDGTVSWQLFGQKF
ncbi:MAG: serine/threonine protein kinase [Planctomycetaceae bacterium]|nr:serine/threonine protein kinase [Planctomycetaceae bacterium]